MEQWPTEESIMEALDRLGYELYNSIEDEEENLDVLRNDCISFASSGNFFLAHKFADKALQMIERIKGPRNLYIWILKMEKAALFLVNKEESSANEMYLESLQVWQQMMKNKQRHAVIDKVRKWRMDALDQNDQHRSHLINDTILAHHSRYAEKDSWDLAQDYTIKGILLFREEKFTDAYFWFKKALAIFPLYGKNIWEAYENLFRDYLYSTCEKLGFDQECYEAFQHYLEVAKTQFGEDSLQLSPILKNLVRIAVNLKHIADAETYLQGQIDLHERNQDKSPQLGQAYLTLGKLYIAEHKKPVEGISFLRQAISLYPQDSEEEYLFPKFDLYRTLAFSRIHIPDIPFVRKVHTEALRLADKRGVKDGKYYEVCLSAGSFYLTLGELNKASAFLRTAMEEGRAIWGVDHQYARLSRFCWVGIEMGLNENFVEGERILDELGENLEDIWGAKELVYRSLGIAYHQTGRYEKSIKYYQKSLEWLQANDPQNPRVQEVIAEIAKMEVLAGRKRNPIKALYKARKEIASQYGKKHEKYIEALLALIHGHLLNGDADAAIRYVRDCLAFYQELPEEQRGRGYNASLLFAVGVFASTGQEKQAGYYLSELNRRKVQYPNPLEWASIDFSLIEVFSAQINMQDYAFQTTLLKGIERKLTLLEESFDYLSEQDKGYHVKHFQLQIQGLLRSFLLSSQVGKADPEKIYDFWLRAKGLVLTSTFNIRERILSRNNPEELKLYEQWLALRKEKLTRFQVGRNESNEEWEERLNHHEKQLNFQVKQEKRPIVSSRMIQRMLEKEEIAIECISLKMPGIFEDRVDPGYLILILFPGERLVEYIWLKNGLEIEELILRQAKSNDKVELLQIGKELWKILWQQIQEKIKNFQKVYISLDGRLHLLNMNILVNPATNQHLIDEKEIVFLTNTREVLTLKNKLGKIPNHSIILGDPDFGKGIWKQLEGARDESLEIHRLLNQKGRKTQIFLGKEATKDRLFKPLFSSPCILHLATHGFFSSPSHLKKPNPSPVKIHIQHRGVDQSIGYDFDQDPMFQSGLVFAMANKSVEGVLLAYEVATLDIRNVELVVLSACETGLGKIEEGEGVFGLQRAFFIAGAKSMIMSLWKVPDQKTADLFTLFYTYWLQGHSKYEAFRTAQLHFKQTHPNPADWGGFILVEA